MTTRKPDATKEKKRSIPRKPFSEKRLAVSISRVCDAIEHKATTGELTTDESLKYLSALAQLTPSYCKLLESAGMAERLTEVEKILKDKAKA